MREIVSLGVDVHHVYESLTCVQIVQWRLVHALLTRVRSCDNPCLFCEGVGYMSVFVSRANFVPEFRAIAATCMPNARLALITEVNGETLLKRRFRQNCGLNFLPPLTKINCACRHSSARVLDLYRSLALYIDDRNAKNSIRE